MLRIFLAIQLVCAALLLATCERTNMYDVAKYGLPPQTAIFLFPVGPQAGAFGGRNNADNFCYQQGIAYHSLVKASTVKAFVSFSVIDELRFLVPIQYWYYPVMGISPTLTLTTIANSWLDLLSGLASPINTSVGLLATDNFWTGSTSDGGVVTTENCSGWQDSTANGRYGGLGINDGTNPCSNGAIYILCIAY